MIDSREQDGYAFWRFAKWMEGTVTKTLKASDYSVERMVDAIAIERKSLQDAIISVMPPA